MSSCLRIHLLLLVYFMCCLAEALPVAPIVYRLVIRQYQGADKSLTRPGRKQARKHVRDARDFNNIETLAVINFFFLQGKAPEGNSRHSDRNISLFPSCSG